MPSRFARYRNHLTPILAVAIVGSFIWVDSRCDAECGGYVTIGNKAKLRELQEAGYLPKMKSHPEKPSGLPQTNLRITVSLDRFQDPTRAAAAFGRESQHPVNRTCSGPNCRSGKTKLPEPNAVIVDSGVPKSLAGSRKSRNGHDRPSSFVGHRQHDDQPTILLIEIDRPPE